MEAHTGDVPIAVRLLRFMLTGGLAGLLQIELLTVFIRYGWPSVPAGATAALLGAQLNFVLSSLITWRDRPTAVRWRRWLLYHGSIAGTMVLNVLVFTLLRTSAPDALADAGGILAGGIANFILGDHLVFRARPVPYGNPRSGSGRALIVVDEATEYLAWLDRAIARATRRDRALLLQAPVRAAMIVEVDILGEYPVRRF